MRAEREGRVTGLPDAEAVGVGQRVGDGDLGGWVGGVPEVGHEFLLHAQEGWVAAGFELGGGPVELEDLGSIWREGCLSQRK